jgi:FKBP-type peptidyl-prolyl cis-trans isomerase
MKKLSFNEWIGVVAGILFVGYMLFGGTISSAFKRSALSPEANSAIINNAAENTNNQINKVNNGVDVNEVTVGTGAAVEKGMVISVNYVLRLADGTMIQDSKQVNNGKPFQFIYGAGQVIPGWEMGIAGMRVGGKRVVTIPPELGYGANAQGSIPANSTLVFDIEVTAAEPFVQNQVQQ